MKRRSKDASRQQVMLDHVRELQVRLLVCAVVLVIAGAVGYLLFQPILEWLRTPLGTSLYYSAPSGSFSFVMKVATMIGIGITLPVIIYQLIMFIRPALQEVLALKPVYGMTFLSVALAISGAAFAFYLIVPGALHFFAGFQVEGLSALISADSYLSFVTNVLITFMIVFQIPLIMIIIDRIKPISPQKLFKAEKYVIVGGLVVSFLVPFAMDITTSLLIAAPIVALYNLSVGMIIWRHMYAAKQAKRNKQQVAADFALDDQIFAEIISERHMSETEAQDKLSLLNPLHQFITKPTSGQVPDIRRGSKMTQAQMTEMARVRREKMIAEREARVPKAYKVISDIR